jgi:alcohol dehydrogenase class IV
MIAESGAGMRLRHVTPAFRSFAGAEALSWMPAELARLGVERAVVFCGSSMLRHFDALAKVEAAIGDRLVGRFEGVREHSPVPTVEAGRDFLSKVDADGVIAVGGGSAVVTARAATILLAEGRGVRELCTSRDADGRLISPRLMAPKVPQWVVPSTPTTAYAKAGTAVRDLDTGERLAMFDPKTRAQGIFFDPDVALTAPAELARGAALDAFAVSVEGLQTVVDDPLAEALLAQAVTLLAAWLPRLEREPEEPEPRLRLMLGALLCGQGTDYTGGGLVRALAHSVGPRSSTANGVVGAILLPLTMRYNAPVTSAGIERVRYALAPFAGSTSSSSSSSSPLNPSTVDDVVRAVERVLADIQVPTRLRDVGVSAENIPEIIEHTLEDWVLSGARRPAGAAELRTLLETAW